jgi:hypothetical protein
MKNEFVFSDNEWILEDNGQQLASIKEIRKMIMIKTQSEWVPRETLRYLKYQLRHLLVRVTRKLYRKINNLIMIIIIKEKRKYSSIQYNKYIKIINLLFNGFCFTRGHHI